MNNFILNLKIQQFPRVTFTLPGEFATFADTGRCRVLLRATEVPYADTAVRARVCRSVIVGPVLLRSSVGLISSSSGVGFELLKKMQQEEITLILGKSLVDKKISLIDKGASDTSKTTTSRHIYLLKYLSPSFLLERPVSFEGTLVELSSELLSGRPPRNTLAFLFSLV